MKRIILSLTVLLSTIGLWAEEIPDFVMKQAGETFQRYVEWKDGEETLTFPIITDYHAHDRDSYKHIGYLVETDRLFGYDFMINLGDIGLNIGESHTNKAHARDIILKTRAEMGKFNGVFLYVPGNHDWDGSEGTHNTSNFLEDAFQRPNERHAHGNLHIVPGKAYGYYDIPEKNVRVVMLNSSGTETLGENYYTFDNEQLTWLADLLLKTPKGTDIVTFAHYMPHPIGRWTCVKDADRPTCEVLDHLLADFANRRKGGELGLKWNFSRAKGRLVGLFCGDTHDNDFLHEDGVNYYISQGLGWVDPKEMLPTHKHALYDFHNSLCCDVVVLKLKSKQVKTFRIGAGGSDYDYSFPY